MSRFCLQQSANFVSWWQTLSYRGSPHLQASALGLRHTRNFGDGQLGPQALSPPPIDQVVFYYVSTSLGTAAPLRYCAPTPPLGYVQQSVWT